MVLRQLLKRVNCFTLVDSNTCSELFDSLEPSIQLPTIIATESSHGIQHDDGHEYLEPVPCQGPRGISLPDSPQDSLNPSLLDGGEYAITVRCNVTDGRT